MLPDERIQSLGALLRERARNTPDADFLIFERDRRSFARLLTESEALAKGLIARGLEPGDHIAILMPNSIEAATIFYAAHLAGAVAVPINARFKRRELRHVVTHSDTRFLFTTQAVREHVDFVELIWDSIDGLADASDANLSLEAAPCLRNIVVCGGAAPTAAITRADLVADGAAVDAAVVEERTSRVMASDVAFLLYTSGTTAAPKGCELTHKAIIRSWGAYAEVIGLQAGSAIWTPCPFFHIGGIGPMTSALLYEARLISMSHFETAEALRMIEEHRPGHLFPAFPALTLGVLRSPLYDRGKFAFVETVVNVSPPETQALIQSMLPPTAKLLNDFGMTEGSGIITMTRPGDSEERRLASNGRALPGIEVRIVDSDSGTCIPDGTNGEIQFRGVNAFRSYYKDPEATSRTIGEGGWVSTGDLGRLDEANCLHFIGRIKDILKVGGENVAPAEVEAHLSTHRAVKMVQVVGKPDDKYGEVAVAFVELLPGETTSPQVLIDYCKGALASFKVPREIRFIEEWPMSATKIQKYKLKELLECS
jgi:fatty-acyl-CoA synthase